MEFENAFSRPGKVMKFGENDQGHGKVMKLKFFCLDLRIFAASKSRISLFIYSFMIFKQACPVQHGWFKWRPVKNSIIQIN